MIRLLILLSLLLSACGGGLDHQPVAQGSTVLAFGDSITWGTGAGRGQDYPGQLAAATGWRVVNGGLPGDTAAAATGRIAQLLAEHDPALVIVELGGNDFLARRSPPQVKEDLRAIIHSIRRHGSQVVLVAVPAFSVFRATLGSLADAAIYSELGDEEGVLVIDGLLADILSADQLRADPIHPNAAGYRQLAAGIAEALADAGLAGY